MQRTDLTDILLSRRGITESQKRDFLNPSYEEHLHDPFLMKDMERACVRIFEATEAKEKIVIFGDYDCDGIPGGVILHDFFKKIKYEHFRNYVPDRHIEGYGLNKAAIESFQKEGVTLVITVDLGTTNIEEIALAQGFGIDVIVVDHHLPHGALPKAYAILNPKQEGDTYPYNMLCGAGLAFKLVQGLIKKYGEYWNIPTGFEKWLLDMAGLATLSDMVPLTGENRVLAHFGLKVLQKNRRPGLQKLFKKMNIDARFVSEDDITFMVTPRLNAASRMDSPMRAFELLATSDEVEGGMLADHLAKINDERKMSVVHIMREVKSLLERREDRPVIFIGNPKWRVGVLGLVASKIAEEYEKPAFVWGLEGAEEDSLIKGSCRSDGSVNIVSLMTAIPEDSLANFGGHELAGGFSVTREKIHFLEEALTEAYGRTRNKNSEQKRPDELVDATLFLGDVHMDTYRTIEQLSPFGVGNPKPIFLFDNVQVVGVKLFGKEKNHLELSLVSDEGRTTKAISFFATPESFKNIPEPGKRIRLIASFDLSRFAGKTELRLRIVDII